MATKLVSGPLFSLLMLKDGDTDSTVAIGVRCQCGSEFQSFTLDDDDDMFRLAINHECEE